MVERPEKPQSIAQMQKLNFETPKRDAVLTPLVFSNIPKTIALLRFWSLTMPLSKLKMGLKTPSENKTSTNR